MKEINADCYNVISLVAIAIKGEISIGDFEEQINSLDIPKDMKDHAIIVASHCKK